MKDTSQDTNINLFRTFTSTYRQTTILTGKNMLVMFKKSRFLVFQLATLALINISIILFNWIIKYTYEHSPSLIYQKHEISNIKKCNFSTECKSLGYAILGEHQNWVNFSLNEISRKSGLEIGEDIFEVYRGTDVMEMLGSIKKNSDFQFSTILVYCSTNMTIFNKTVDCRGLDNTYVYWLLYNESLVSPNMLDNLNSPRKASIEAMRAARMVENSLTNWIMKERVPNWENEVEHNFTVQNYPRVQSHIFSNYDTSSEQFCFWYFIPIVVSLLAFTNEILKEKEKKLRIGLMYFGVNAKAYWLSWALVILIFDIGFSILVIIIGKLSGFCVFLNTQFWLLLFCFVTMLFGNHSVGLLLCCLTPNRKSGAKLCYSFGLVTLFIHLVFGRTGLAKFFFIDDLGISLKIFKWVLCSFPSFLVMIAFEDITKRTGNNYSGGKGAFDKGGTYPVYKFFTRENGHFFRSKYSKISPFESLIYTWIISLGYIALIGIFDKMISSNRGYSQALLTSNCCKKKRRRVNRIREEEAEESGIFDYGTKTDLTSIKLIEVFKTYESCSCLSKVNYSLRNFSVEIFEGEIIGLLGPNGAGKTTLIKIISGVLNITAGEYQCYGMDSKYHGQSIRKICNVCPQFDILWPELTIYDHTSLICRLKGFKGNRKQLREYSLGLMTQVNLGSSLDESISALSGGMRRRVSIALATIGQPKIVVFDEPTTGLDPENRMLIWDFIKRIKQPGNVTILLSSHILEEADNLSDRLVIMSKGQLVAVGTSSELKNQFGNGIKLEVILKKSGVKLVQEFKEFVKSHAASCQLMDSSGGCLLFVLGMRDLDEMKVLLRTMEELAAEEESPRDNVMGNVEYYAVSNSSLEEVFIAATEEI